MKIDHHSPIPLYKQIEQVLRELIDSGDYDRGKYLPKEEELARRWGVSRNTVRQGIVKLVHEGLLTRKPGLGTTVSRRNITTHLTEWHSFTEEMRKRGIKVRNYMVNACYEPAPDDVSESFQVKKATKLLKLERLRGDEEQPFVYFVSWFHPRVQLTDQEDFSLPLYQILEEKLSIFPSYSDEELMAIPASKKVAACLQVAENTPVLFRRRLVYDTGNRIIEYNIGYYQSDKFVYSISIKREN